MCKKKSCPLCATCVQYDDQGSMDDSARALFDTARLDALAAGAIRYFDLSHQVISPIAHQVYRTTPMPALPTAVYPGNALVAGRNASSHFLDSSKQRCFSWGFLGGRFSRVRLPPPPLGLQRTKNYAFDYRHVLNMKGNTAVFLLYASARLAVRAVFD